MTFFLCVIVFPIVTTFILMIYVEHRKSVKEIEKKENERKALGISPAEQLLNDWERKALEKDQPIRCPKCGSNQIYANKKGFSAGKAVAGAVVAGGIGLAAGGIGSNKVIITCLKCGHQFKPGKQL